MARRAEQAVLHDARDVVPGIQELVEAYRNGRPSAREIQQQTFHVTDRGYHLLLGLRQPRAWATIRPRAFEATVSGLSTVFDTLICDTDADLEGEADGGSIDVEDRNVMARTIARQADVVFVVGAPGVKGTHALTRVIGDLLAYGVPPEVLVPVVNRGPRRRRMQEELGKALREFLPPGMALDDPLILPERKVDEALRDGIALPVGIVEPLAHAWDHLHRRVQDAPGSDADAYERFPQRIEPGALGVWTDDVVATMTDAGGEAVTG
jgi:hypothetical protein